MKYLLDTNTCIRYLNGTSENIKNQFKRHNPNKIALCTIVKAELFYGAFKSAKPNKNLEKIKEFFSHFIHLHLMIMHQANLVKFGPHWKKREHQLVIMIY